MNTPKLKTRSIDKDSPECSICPSCEAQVIKLADGCGVCGGREEDKLLGGEENLSRCRLTVLEQKEKRSSLSRELSIPCLIKQPNQPEVKGIIQKDLGDRFVVDVDGEEISISKLFVYPDFNKSVGQIEKSPRKNITPSKENPRKTRRKKGQGNGTIYYRTVTKKGSEYQEAYYHYRSNGKKRTKYIPKKLLTRVKEAESLKLPVSDILILLGGDKKNPRKSSSNCSSKNDVNEDVKVSDTSDKCSSKTTPPSTQIKRKVRRKKGEGSGHIYYRTVTRNGKKYQQAYYQWREDGKQRTKYIPKKLLVMVQEAESQKLPVADILNLLGEKQKCSSKSSDICEAVSFRTLSAEVDEKVLNRSDICSSKIESKSKSQRRRGEGSGSIYWRTIKKNGKEYKQTYYHYELWSKGDRLVKSCEYIPLKMRSQIEKMNAEKVPVEEILKVLRKKKKR